MAQPISSLPVGTRFVDPNGIAPHGNREWILVGFDQYGSNTALCLLDEDYTEIRHVFHNASTVGRYTLSDINNFLSNTVLSNLSVNLQNAIQLSTITFRDSTGSAIPFSRSVFLLSAREYQANAFSSPPTNSHLSYFSNDERREFPFSYWSRDMANSSNAYIFDALGNSSPTNINNTRVARYAFSIPTTISVQGTPNADGSYNLVLPGPQTVDDLPLGTVVKDPSGSSPHGNRSWVKIAEDHFSVGQNTFYLNENYLEIESAFESDGSTTQYPNSTVDNFLQNTVQVNLSQSLQGTIISTSIISRSNTGTIIPAERKLFLLSRLEITGGAPQSEGNPITYLSETPSNRAISDSSSTYWTRSVADTVTAIVIVSPVGGVSTSSVSLSTITARYAFNLPSTTRVNPTANADGSYNLQLNQPPNKPVITQINGANTSSNSLSPQITAPNMTFTTTYQDPDSDPLQLSNLVVSILGGSEVFNQNITTSTSTFTQDLTGVVVAGSQYEIKVRHQDNQGNFSEFSDLVYIQIGETATPPTPIAPIGAIRVGLTRQLEASIGSGRNGTPQHFKVRLRTVSPTDTGYPAIIVFDSDDEISSVSDQTGWEVRRISDQTYIALPSGGADSATYDRVRYTPQTNLQDTKAYLGRWSTYDTQYQFFSGEGTKFSFVAGNTIRFTTDVTDSTSRPGFAVGVYQGTAVTAGATGSRDINMANNANDATFTFEDADDLLATGHTFANTTKTATNWGIQVDVSGSINETVSNTETVNITGFSYAYRTV